MKKFFIPIILTTSLFSSDSLNQYFKDNNISINCENNKCSGSNIKLNDTFIEYLSFNLNNGFEMPLKDNIKCNQIELKKECDNEYFYSILKNITLNSSIKLNNYTLSDNSKIGTLTSNSHLPILNILDNKSNLTFDNLISNNINLDIKDMTTKNNEFQIYLDLVNKNIIELTSIPKNEWDDEIEVQATYYLNLHYLLTKLNEKSLSNNNINLNILLKPNIDEKLNTLFYNGNIIMNGNNSSYNIDFKISLKNISGIKKNFDKIENKDIALALLIPSFNVDQINIISNFEKINMLHNSLIESDIKYKESFNYIKEYLSLYNQYEENNNPNDKVLKKINQFTFNLINMKYNEHKIQINNSNNQLLVELLSSLIEKKGFDIDKFVNSLDLELSNK